MNKKIYCKFCIFLKHFGSVGENYYDCRANLKDSWLKPSHVGADPSIKNKNNDCRHFKKDEKF